MIPKRNTIADKAIENKKITFEFFY